MQCEICELKYDAILRDLLNQPDYAGLDYEDDSRNATVRCPGEGCTSGVYVTAMCEGKPIQDCGKFHNHCTDCKGYGKCIYDYRNAHCFDCNSHYFAGCVVAFDCQNCERKRRDAKHKKFIQACREGDPAAKDKVRKILRSCGIDPDNDAYIEPESYELSLIHI